MAMPTPSSTSPAASALGLREFFGDRKPPPISRKITACVACRKLKIKCHMPDSKPPCTRCKRRDLSCMINHSLQMLLENDVTWKRAIEQKLQLIQEQINNIADGNKGSTLATPAASQLAVDTTPQSQPSWEVVMDPKLNPGALPASCIAQVVVDTSVPDQDSHQDRAHDLISRGTIPISTAEHCFDTYMRLLDHHVYSILANRTSLASVRASSALLTAAVCAVGALHTPGLDTATYAVCYGAFLQEHAALVACARRQHTLDDVRALCIGAFWLSDLSWMLSGTAVRVAIGLNLHRGVSKARHACVHKTATDRRSCYERTRLYLLVYVCDHQTSIAYGRAPMTREFAAIIAPRAFLEIAREGLSSSSSLSSSSIIPASSSPFQPYEKDVRLVAQVELWSILSRVYDTFGINTELAVPAHLLPELRRSGLALETWRIDTGERLDGESGTPHTETDIGLHFYSAKLYLCTHAFRGVSSASSTGTVAPELEELADGAVSAARSLLRSLVVSRSLQTQLGHLPTYYATMVAAAVVFLLKMTVRRPAGIHIDAADTRALLDQVAGILAEVTAGAHPQNVLAHIAASIMKLLGLVQQEAVVAAPMDASRSIRVGVDGDGSGPSFSTGSNVGGTDDLTWLQDGDFAIDWFDFDQVLHSA